MGQNPDYKLGDNQALRETLSSCYTTLSSNLDDMCNQFVQQHTSVAGTGLWQSPAFNGSRASAGSNLGSANFGTFTTALRQWQQHMGDSLSTISSGVLNQGNAIQSADSLGGLPGGRLPNSPLANLPPVSSLPPISSNPPPSTGGGTGLPPDAGLGSGVPGATGLPNGAGVGGAGAGLGAGGLSMANLLAASGIDPFPEPKNMGDIAREIIRKQDGNNHFLIITRFGTHAQNNWLITIPDVGNNNSIQDPGDPGVKISSPAGKSGVVPSGGTAASAISPAPPSPTSPSSLSTTAAAGDPNSYLNNAQSAQIEFKGQVSPYGEFVAQAVQQYCSPTPPDQQTSPLHPAMLWLAGHGLGGMVAQNLAAKAPFPGDNPATGHSHIVKGVIGFGSPIVGADAKGVAYDLYDIPGDRAGDIPVDSGINDARRQSVHKLKNPFLSPPWQSTNPSGHDYVKNPTDPSTIHSGYADSEELTQARLPFQIGGKGATWGPTYVIPIPQTLTGATHASTSNLAHSVGSPLGGGDGMSVGALGALGATILAGGGIAALAYVRTKDADDDEDVDEEENKKGK